MGWWRVGSYALEMQGQPHSFQDKENGGIVFINNGADVEHPLHVPPRSPLMGGGAAGCRARMAAAPIGTWSLPAKARPLTSSRTSLQALRRGGRGMGWAVAQLEKTDGNDARVHPRWSGKRKPR